MRPYKAEDYLALKSAFHRACEDVGSLSEVAMYTRVSMTLLSAYGNPDRPEYPPMDVMLDVDALSGGDRCLRAIAELRGYKLEREEKGVRCEDLNRHVGAVGKESGELISAMCIAISDNKITPTEAGRIERDADDLVDNVRLLKADMRRIRAA
jgi:hypothetical protein